MSFIKSLFISALMLVSISSEAAVVYFGDLLSGSYQPGSNFAELSVSGSGNVYNFTLKAYDLETLFLTSGAKIGRLAIDTDKAINPSDITISSVSGGVTSVFAKNAGAPTGTWDFSFKFPNSDSDKLTANESISWTATFSQDVSFTQYAVHVQGLTTEQGSSAWYTSVTAVPEPETYGMMALGLGLMALIVRRKNNQA